MEDFIYHYTTISTLALILSSKKIRFNRLDKVDDIEEGELKIGPNNLKMGQYTFVSCWTKDPIENIALWNMYTKYQGIRIKMKPDIFKGYTKSNSKVQLYFDEDKIYEDKGCYINHLSNIIQLYDVIYTDKLEESVQNSTIEIKRNHFYIMNSKIGIWKSKQWEFQKECRFKIIVYPYSKDRETEKCLFNNNCPINLNELYIDLNENAFTHMEITLGPLCTESDKIIVQSLLSYHNIIPQVKNSNLRLRK